MFFLKSCPKCHEDLQLLPEDRVWWSFTCVQCGWLKWVLVMPNPPSRVALGADPSASRSVQLPCG